MILSSFRKEYGISSKELNEITWREFKALLGGLGGNTALGRIVAIRSEEDKECLKYFTREEHKIRNKYRNKIAKNISEQDMSQFLEEMKNAFIGMAGGQVLEGKE